jgi:DNA-binding CsgD family transcriptional regulator
MDGSDQKQLSFTSAWFIVLQVVFARGYTSFMTTDGSFRIYIAIAAFVAWIILAVCSKYLWLKPFKLFVLASVLLLTAFIIQMIVIENSENVLAAPAGVRLLEFSCLALGAGSSAWWWLWVRVYDGYDAMSVFVSVLIGLTLGIFCSNLPILLLRHIPGGSLICSAIRLLLFATAALCLFIELRKTSEQDKSSTMIPSGRIGILTRGIGPTVAAFALANLALYAIAMRGEELASVGIWLVMLALLTVDAVTGFLVFRFGKAPFFQDYLCGAFVLIALILYIIYISVTGSEIQSLWMLTFIANPLLDLAIMGRISTARSRYGLWVGRFTCFAFALKELAVIAGLLLCLFVPGKTVVLLMIVLLLAFTSYFIFSQIMAIIKSERNRTNDENGGIPEHARQLALTHSLTKREREILEYLLQGSSYARIARKLFIAESTTKTHATHIYSKLGIGGRDELIDSYYIKSKNV